MKTGGKMSKNNLMLMKTWQGERGENEHRFEQAEDSTEGGLKKHLCLDGAGSAAGLTEGETC